MGDRYFNEERCWSIFEKLLDEKFKKVRPYFLLNNETGFCLEFDGYCKQLKLAFEYDGIQHHEYPNLFHRSKREFLQQRMRDEMKNFKCKFNEVTLIRITSRRG